jgi:hypothetical protein
MTGAAFGLPSVWGGVVSIPAPRHAEPEDHPEYHEWLFADVPKVLLQAFRDDLKKLACTAGPSAWIDLSEIIAELRRRP